MRYLSFVRGRLVATETAMEAFDSYLFYYCKLHSLDHDSIGSDDFNFVAETWIEHLILFRQIHLNDDKGRLYDQFVLEEDVFSSDVCQDMIDQMSWGDLNG